MVDVIVHLILFCCGDEVDFSFSFAPWNDLLFLSSTPHFFTKSSISTVFLTLILFRFSF